MSGGYFTKLPSNNTKKRCFLRFGNDGLIFDRPAVFTHNSAYRLIKFMVTDAWQRTARIFALSNIPL
jgi:hypothetical protein